MIDRRIFIFYFTSLLLLAPFLLLHFDSFYYWDWSRHLALSYYDGSPMIAYFIKLSTLLFGDNVFALSVVGIVTTAIASVLFFKTARLFLEKDASYIALSLWLFSPLVTIDLLKATTYNNPLTLFWILTLYTVVRYLKFEKTRDLYWIGLSAGLLLLSKYTGVVLFLGLLVFLITSKYRNLFKNPHFYGAMFLSLLCFSPVLIWNYQHDWLSFLYQLNIHRETSAHSPLINITSSVVHRFLPALNFMLLPPLICLFLKFNTAKNPPKPFFLLIVRLCLMICSAFLVFYLYVSSHNKILPSWLACYLITSALLAGALYQEGFYRIPLRILAILYFIVSIMVLVYNTVFFSTQIVMNPRFIPLWGADKKPAFSQEISKDGLARMQENYSDKAMIEHIKNNKGSLETHKEFKKYISYLLIQNINRQYPYIPKKIFTSGWLEARKFFFLNGKPQVFALGCGSLTNQYSLWSKDILNQIKNTSLKEIVFIDQVDHQACLKNYFSHCVRMPLEPLLYNNQEYALFMYQCDNKTQAYTQ